MIVLLGDYNICRIQNDTIKPMDNSAFIKQPSTQSTDGPESGRQNNIGCGIPLIFAFFWIGSVVGVSQAAIWFIEQGIMEGSIGSDPGRWLINLVAGLAIAIPFSLLSFVKHLFYKHTFQIWGLAGLAMLALVPARLLSLTDSQGVSAIQILGLSLVSMVVFLALKYKKLRTPSLSKEEGIIPLLISLGIALIAAIPWVINGALGSWLDTLLGLGVGLACAVCLWLIVQFGFLQIPEFGSNRHLLMKGLIVSQALLILSAGLGLNGNEWLLILLLPVAGWLAAGMIENSGLLNNGFIWLVGLITALPLIWVDADELSLVITIGSGELFEWMGATAVISLVGLFVATVLYVFLLRWLRRQRVGLKFGLIILTLLGILVGGLYFLVGTPGFYGEKLFVILKDQSILANISEDLAPLQQRQMVYDTLVAHAERTQAALRQDLSRAGIPYKPYYLVNAIEVEAGPIIRLWLSMNPAVSRVLDSPYLRPLPEKIPTSTSPTPAHSGIDWNLKMIQADKVWQEFGVKGQGVIIGQSDSGVEGDHPEFANRYLGTKVTGDYTWFDPWNFSSFPSDIGGHGTHTLGIILGKSVGVAPEANWIGCVNLARNLGNPAYYLDCMQFMLAPFPQKGDPFKDGNPGRGANVLNNSWGCPEVEGCDALSLEPAVRALRKAGIFVVVSAGNSGENGCGSVDSPLAIYQEVYTVGALTSQEKRAGFSSIGPVNVDGSGRTKPDILAPGAQILSSYPGKGYNTVSGTSMAGPHVAGVVALMWSANPKLIGDIDLTTQILNQTAKPYRYTDVYCGSAETIPTNISGYGIVDAYEAVKLAMSVSSR